MLSLNRDTIITGTAKKQIVSILKNICSLNIYLSHFVLTFMFFVAKHFCVYNKSFPSFYLIHCIFMISRQMFICRPYLNVTYCRNLLTLFISHYNR